MPEVIVDISPAGQVKIEANGYTGTACTKATEQLELILGGGSQKRKPKPEYHMPETAGVQNKLTF